VEDDGGEKRMERVEMGDGKRRKRKGGKLGI
jgi:hypothetical protein